MASGRPGARTLFDAAFAFPPLTEQQQAFQPIHCSPSAQSSRQMRHLQAYWYQAAQIQAPCFCKTMKPLLRWSFINQYNFARTPMGLISGADRLPCCCISTFVILHCLITDHIFYARLYAYFILIITGGSDH